MINDIPNQSCSFIASYGQLITVIHAQVFEDRWLTMAQFRHLLERVDAKMEALREPQGEATPTPAPSSQWHDANGNATRRLDGSQDVTFGSGDSASITNYVGQLVEVSPVYREDFSDGLAQGWTASSGTWAVTTGGYRQSGTANNTNAYRAQTQNQLLVYRWQATFTSGVNAGMYLLASATTGAERGNSYRVWQDATSVKIYE
ncbi:MAG: hypothetical protein WAV79_15150, partial [Anaerolineae bacterium]